MQVKSTHTINILTQLIEGKSLCSSDIMASNSNQYFNQIKNNNVELIEVWKPNIKNAGKHKERSLKQTEENIKRANDYLNSLLGKPRDASQGDN